MGIETQDRRIPHPEGPSRFWLRHIHPSPDFIAFLITVAIALAIMAYTVWSWL